MHPAEIIIIVLTALPTSGYAIAILLTYRPILRWLNLASVNITMPNEARVAICFGFPDGFNDNPSDKPHVAYLSCYVVPPMASSRRVRMRRNGRSHV